MLFGDLTDAASLRPALEGAKVVFHCTAKVGDWGPVEDYRAVNVEGLQGCWRPAGANPCGDLVHFSSLGVYAARHHHGTDETAPLPKQHINGYTQSKVESERLALQYQRGQGVPVTVLRPGFIYGPDRTVLPNLIDKLRRREVRYIGNGRGAMNCIFVGNLVQAALLAMEKPEAVGQVYNVTDGETVSKRRFIEAVADGVGAPGRRAWGAVVARADRGGVAGGHGAARGQEAPQLTQGRLKFLGLNLDFSIEKAKRNLGSWPHVSFEEGMRLTTDWYKRQA